MSLNLDEAVGPLAYQLLRVRLSGTQVADEMLQPANEIASVCHARHMTARHIHSRDFALERKNLIKYYNNFGYCKTKRSKILKRMENAPLIISSTCEKVNYQNQNTKSELALDS